MAVRQDQVQLRVDFITDESRQLARTLLTTKEYNKEIAASTAKIAEYQRQLAKVGADEAKRAPILAKIAAEEKKVADNLGRVATEGKKVEKLDLGRVAPAQLVERARQLAQAMRLIPQSAPQFKQLQTELSGVNARLREINQTAKAGQAAGGGGLGNLTGLLTGGVRALPVIGAVVAGFEALRGAFTGASELEQLNISFETFLGNAEKAKQVVRDLREFADVTPFETEEVNKAGRSLLAFGFSAEDLIPTLRTVGDVAAGTGKDFGELALIYGKARTEGLIQNDTLNQLAEAGVPIYTELAKVLNVNESQIRKLAEQGKIQFADLQQAFANLTGEGSKFGGLMEKQSKSIGGLYSTLKSQLTNLLTGLGTALTPAIKSVLEGLIPAVELLGRIAVPIFNAIGSVISFVVNELTIGFTQTLPNLISRFVQAGESIPILGKGISNLLIPIRVVIDAFESLRATGVGVMAALENIFTTGGYNAGKAYSEARNRALEEERQEAARAAAENARDDRQLSEKEKAEIAAQEKKAAAERAAAQQKANEESRKRAEAALQAALSATDVAIKREELLLENARIRGQIDEEEYQSRLTAINEQGLNARLDVFRKFGREQSNAALEVQNSLSEIQAGRAIRGKAPVATLGARPVGPVESTTATEEVDLGPTVPTPDALRARFSTLIDAELQYNILRSELQSAYYAEQLAQLEANGQAETDKYREIAERKKAADQSVADNKAQLADFQTRVQDAQDTAFQESINFAVTLLGKDEAARKKYAGAIKAFQIGQVVTAGISEIQKIYSKYALVPGGALLAQPEAIAAGFRTAGAVLKIAVQKFAGGGYTGSGIGSPDETGYRPAGIVHEGEYVIPKKIVQNAQAAPVLRWLEGKRLRGYADGGLVQVNTTPTALPSVPVQATAALTGMEVFVAAVAQFTATVAQFPKEVKSRVVVTELETAQGELDKVRQEAAT